MVQQTKDKMLILDYSKDQNAFKWFSGVFLASFGFIALYISIIFILKILGYADQDLSWMPFSTENFPFKGEIVEYVGTIIVFILGVVLLYYGWKWLIIGKISQVHYNKSTREIISYWNGSLKKVSKLNIDDISYLRKKRDKPRSQSIKGSTNYSPVMVIRWNRAYAVNKESKQYILLFEHYDKSKFDKGFREINKLIKNIT
jgi:hypothetical protein